MGDRVAVMNQGQFEQVDTPRKVYDNPASEFVARFIGRSNVWVIEMDGNYSRLIKRTPLEFIVRPEDIAIDLWNIEQPLVEGKIAGTIVDYAFLGRTVRLEIQLKNGKLITVALPKLDALARNLSQGKSVTLAMGSCQVFPL